MLVRICEGCKRIFDIRHSESVSDQIYYEDQACAIFDERRDRKCTETQLEDIKICLVKRRRKIK